MSTSKRAGLGITRSQKCAQKQTPVSTEAPPQNLEVSVCVPILKSLNELFKKAASMIQREIQRIENGHEDNLSKQFITAQARTLYEAEQLLWQIADNRRVRMESVSLQIARGVTGTFTEDGKEASRKDQEEISAAVSAGVELRRTDNTVVIRMPYLPPRGVKKTTVATDILAAAILHSYDQLPRWNSCTLTITHVYPQRVAHMPKDVDNYDYKRVIDLICYGLGVSDCAATCSILLDTFFTDDMAPGTYILAEEKIPQKFEKQHWTNAQKIEHYRPTPDSKPPQISEKVPEKRRD